MEYLIHSSTGELYHHGIKGQKWGVKHGPPYPLDQKVSSNVKKNSDINYKAAIAGTIAFGAVFALSVSSPDQIARMASVGKGAIEKVLASIGGLKYTNLTRQNYDGDNYMFDKLSKPLNNKEICAKVNPDYSPFEPLTNSNCAQTSVSFVANKMGLDVVAHYNDEGTLFTNIMGVFKGTHPENYIPLVDLQKPTSSLSKEETLDKIKTRIASSLGNEDGYGIINVRGVDYGHFMNWEKTGNEVKLHDGQVYKIIKDADQAFYRAFNYVNVPANSLTFNERMAAFRCDNLEIDRSKLYSFCHNAKDKKNKNVAQYFVSIGEVGDNFIIV